MVNLQSGFSPTCFVFSESCRAQSRDSFHSRETPGNSESCWIPSVIDLESLGPRKGKPVRPKAPANGRAIWHILGEIYSWILKNIIAYQGLPIPHPFLECELCWLCLASVEEPVNLDVRSYDQWQSFPGWHMVRGSNPSKTHLLWVSIVALMGMLGLSGSYSSSRSNHLKHRGEARRKPKKPLGGQGGHQKFIDYLASFIYFYFRPDLISLIICWFIADYSLCITASFPFRNRSKKLATLWWSRGQGSFKNTNKNARHNLRWGQKALCPKPKSSFILDLEANIGDDLFVLPICIRSPSTPPGTGYVMLELVLSLWREMKHVGWVLSRKLENNTTYLERFP